MRLTELSADSRRREIHNLRERTDLAEDAKQKIAATLNDVPLLWTTVSGPHGEHFFANGPTDLPEDKLPKVITRFYTGNINPYRSRTNNEPPEGFQVLLDFGRPPFLDWQNPISAPTANDSNVLAKGEQAWTGSVIKCVEDQLETCRNRREFVHRPFAYDLGLFLLVLPLAFLTSKRVAPMIENFAGTGTTTLSVMLHVYVFAALLWTYRLIFSYARWAFPVMEITSPRASKTVHKWLLGVVVAALIAETIHTLFVVFGAPP